LKKSYLFDVNIAPNISFPCIFVLNHLYKKNRKKVLVGSSINVPKFIEAEGSQPSITGLCAEPQ
jgi:hypothetical protein